MAFQVIVPLQTVVTADGELKRGKAQIDEQILRIECAMDGSWVCLHDDSHGDPLAYDILTIGNDGLLRSEQPTLTIGWTPEHFALVQNYITQIEEPAPEQKVAPLFIRRPQQGFSVPQPTRREEEVAAPAPAVAPVPDKKKQREVFVVSLCYLVMGFMASQSNNTFLWLLGGFMLLLGIRGLYQSRTMLPTFRNPQRNRVWITSAICFVVGAFLAVLDETRTVPFVIGCMLMIYGIVKPIEYSRNQKSR